jgi:hypothetical protein
MMASKFSFIKIQLSNLTWSVVTGLHHSHVFALKGDSYRIKHRLTPAKGGEKS